MIITKTYKDIINQSITNLGLNSKPFNDTDRTIPAEFASNPAYNHIVGVMFDALDRYNGMYRSEVPQGVLRDELFDRDGDTYIDTHFEE